MDMLIPNPNDGRVRSLLAKKKEIDSYSFHLIIYFQIYEF